MFKIIVFSMIPMLSSACATITTIRVPLQTGFNECQVSDAKPTIFATVVLIACYDENGSLVYLQSHPGSPEVDLIKDAAQVGAILGAAGTLTAAHPSITTKDKVTVHLGP